MRLIELSHVIEAGMVTYPGLPGPHVGEHLSFDESRSQYAPGTEFSIGKVIMVSNTGTYLDTPAHRHRKGHDLSGLALEKCANLPTLVIRANESGPIDADLIPTAEVADSAVLFHTGWDRHWRSEHYGDASHPHLTEAAAELLVGRKAAVVGIDSVNIDGTTTGERPAHTQLLAAGIPVVEHLTGLGSLPPSGSRFFATPPAFKGLATFPVRAFVISSGD